MSTTNLPGPCRPVCVPGWLLHLVCNESLKTDFDAAHNAIVGAVEVRPKCSTPCTTQAAPTQKHLHAHGSYLWAMQSWNTPSC